MKTPELIKMDVVIQRKEDQYYLYSPLHNCIASDNSLDSAYNKLVKNIKEVEKEKDIAGIQDKKPYSFSSFPKNRGLLGEMGGFALKLSLLLVLFLGAFSLGIKTVVPKIMERLPSKAGLTYVSLFAQKTDLPEDRKIQFRQDLQTIATNLRPYIRDLKPIWDEMAKSFSPEKKGDQKE